MVVRIRFHRAGGDVSADGGGVAICAADSTGGSADGAAGLDARDVCDGRIALRTCCVGGDLSGGRAYVRLRPLHAAVDSASVCVDGAGYYDGAVFVLDEGGGRMRADCAGRGSGDWV